MTTLMTRRLGGALLALGPIVGAGDTRAQSYEHLLIFGSRGSGDGQFLSPTGVAVAASGDIVVADSDNDRIQVFDGAGTHPANLRRAGAPAMDSLRAPERRARPADGDRRRRHPQQLQVFGWKWQSTPLTRHERLVIASARGAPGDPRGAGLSRSPRPLRGLAMRRTAARDRAPDRQAVVRRLCRGVDRPLLSATGRREGGANSRAAVYRLLTLLRSTAGR